VIFDRHIATIHIDRRQEPLTSLHLSSLHPDPVDNQSRKRPLGIQDLCEHCVTTQVSDVAQLTTGFRIEGGLIEHNLALLSRIDLFDRSTICYDRND
jgi:hypothetical protein